MVCLTMYHTQREATANALDIIYSLNYIHKQGGREGGREGEREGGRERGAVTPLHQPTPQVTGGAVLGYVYIQLHCSTWDNSRSSAGCKVYYTAQRQVHCNALLPTREDTD